ncbi:16627_t:CDS:1, partial [Racocetra persica]
YFCELQNQTQPSISQRNPPTQQNNFTELEVYLVEPIDENDEPS